MKKELKKTYLIKIIQLLLYLSAVILATYHIGKVSLTPFLLALLAGFIGNFIPLSYRPNFSKTEPSLYFKGHRRYLESMVEFAFGCGMLFTVILLNLL